MILERDGPKGGRKQRKRKDCWNKFGSFKWSGRKMENGKKNVEENKEMEEKVEEKKNKEEKNGRKKGKWTDIKKK